MYNGVLDKTSLVLFRVPIVTACVFCVMYFGVLQMNEMDVFFWVYIHLAGTVFIV